MAEEQATSNNQIDSNEQAISGRAPSQRTRHAATRLKGWAQRAMSRWGKRYRQGKATIPSRHRASRSPLTVQRTRFLLRRLQRSGSRAKVWNPDLEAMKPKAVERFSHSVTRRYSGIQPLSSQKRAKPTASAWGQEVDLILPVGPAASSGASPAATKIQGPSVFTAGQRIEPQSAIPTLPQPSPRAATPPRPEGRPQPKKLPSRSRLYSRVQEVTSRRETSPQSATTPEGARGDKTEREGDEQIPADRQASSHQEGMPGQQQPTAPPPIQRQPEETHSPRATKTGPGHFEAKPGQPATQPRAGQDDLPPVREAPRPPKPTLPAAQSMSDVMDEPSTGEEVSQAAKGKSSPTASDRASGAQIPSRPESEPRGELPVVERKPTAGRQRRESKPKSVDATPAASERAPGVQKAPRDATRSPDEGEQLDALGQKESSESAEQQTHAHRPDQPESEPRDELRLVERKPVARRRQGETKPQPGKPETTDSENPPTAPDQNPVVQKAPRDATQSSSEGEQLDVPGQKEAAAPTEQPPRTQIPSQPGFEPRDELPLVERKPARRREDATSLDESKLDEQLARAPDTAQTDQPPIESTRQVDVSKESNAAQPQSSKPRGTPAVQRKQADDVRFNDSSHYPTPPVQRRQTGDLHGEETEPLPLARTSELPEAAQPPEEAGQVEKPTSQPVHRMLDRTARGTRLPLSKPILPPQHRRIMQGQQAPKISLPTHRSRGMLSTASGPGASQVVRRLIRPGASQVAQPYTTPSRPGLGTTSFATHQKQAQSRMTTPEAILHRLGAGRGDPGVGRDAPMILPSLPRPDSLQAPITAGSASSSPAAAQSRPAVELPASPVDRADPLSMPLAHKLPPQPAAGEGKIQRLAQPTSDESAPQELVSQATIVQRATDESREPAEPDLAQLAQRVYPLIKRLLAVERERWSGRSV